MGMVESSNRNSWYLGFEGAVSRVAGPACLAASLYVAAPVSAQELAKGAPYTLRCYQAGVLVVVEQLWAWPRKDQGVWKGERWSTEATELGAAVWVEAGGHAVCAIHENAKRK